VLNLVFEALNCISSEVHPCRYNSNRGNLTVQSFPHHYPLVITSLTDALMLATYLEASCNGETPWEEASDRARGGEEKRAELVLDCSGWAWFSCTKAQERRGAGVGDTCTRFILLLSSIFE
jgi:hypothetical protein